MRAAGDDAGPFLQLIIAALDQAEIPHMLVGSFASGVHGPPRFTNDIDLVIDPTPDSLGKLIRFLSEADVYVNAEVAKDELDRRGQFNVIEDSGTWKADLVYRKDRAFSRSEFERRIAASVLGVPLFLATAEDTILAKLEWARIGGGSEQQLRDVRGIVDVRADNLDLPYIEQWLDELGVRDLWNRVRED